MIAMDKWLYAGTSAQIVPCTSTRGTNRSKKKGRKRRREKALVFGPSNVCPGHTLMQCLVMGVLQRVGGREALWIDGHGGRLFVSSKEV